MTVIHSTERVALAEAEKSPRVAMEKATGVTLKTKLKVNKKLQPFKSQSQKVLKRRALKEKERLKSHLQLKK